MDVFFNDENVKRVQIDMKNKDICLYHRAIGEHPPEWLRNEGIDKISLIEIGETDNHNAITAEYYIGLDHTMSSRGKKVATEYFPLDSISKITVVSRKEVSV
jgi:hypothetical protein